MMLVTFAPASSVQCTSVGDSAASRRFCSGVAGASTRSYAGSPNSRVKSTYSAPGSRPAITVISAASNAPMIPSLSVVHTVPSRRRNDAPALSSPQNPSVPSRRPSTNHLKPTGTSYSRRPSFAGDAIDHRAAHHGLSDARICRPPLPVLKEVLNGHREIVIGWHESHARRDNAVPIVIGVAREGDVELVLQSDQPLHGVRRRRIHPDLAVPIHRHEPECLIHDIAHDGEVEMIVLRDGRPVVNARATEWVDAQSNARRRESPPYRRRCPDRARTR